MAEKYEDPFVKIASILGGDEYLKVAISLLKAEDATDEEIASSTGLRINMVRRVLYDLFGKSLITGIRGQRRAQGVVRIQVAHKARRGRTVYRKAEKKDSRAAAAEA